MAEKYTSDKRTGLVVHAAPFLTGHLSTPRIMLDVILALLPVIGAAIWYFGLRAILVLAAASAGAMLTEWFFGRPKGKTLKDNTGLLTGILVGLTLPPGMALWMAFLGGVVAIGFGKLIWGGLGQNLFNPALVGRAFLQAAFPTSITTWSEQGASFGHLDPTTLAAPLMGPGVDVMTTATPLGLWKFDHEVTPILDLLIGNTAGSLGETASILIILAGIYMVVRRTCDWRIPVSIVLTVAVFTSILYAVNAERFPTPQSMLLSGGLLFGAVYMATDPVTSPMTPRGSWVFGMGIGLLVVLIRIFGGLPEGVMYAILLMNAATPLIERLSQPRVFGRPVSKHMGGSK